MQLLLSFLPLILLLGYALSQGNTDYTRSVHTNVRVRLATNQRGPRNRIIREGRVEVSLDDGRSWGTVCATMWSKREGNVVCKQLGLGYAAMAEMNTQYGNSRRNPWGLVGTLCRGIEDRLGNCFREAQYPTICNARNRNISMVACVPDSADLELGLEDIQRSAQLQSVPMTRLTCAMEEQCVSTDAYVIRRTNPNAERKLLRFSVKASNVGNADVSPYANYREWVWHQCHNHYHSMNVFATFDVYDRRYNKVAQGHKASFCLMDSICNPGVTPKYTCGNTTQGITIGCADVYSSGLDCQWVDVTNLPVGRSYILRVALNPELKLSEISFENNGAECTLNYTGEDQTTTISNCRRMPLWYTSQ